MRKKGWKQTTIGTIMGILFLFGAALPGIASAQDDVKLLQQRLEEMAREMEAVQKKLEDIERKNEAKEEEIEEMDDRLNKAELHTATDKVAFGVELRTRADTLQYKNIQVAPSALVNNFFVDYSSAPNGLNNASLSDIQERIGQFGRCLA
jgi:DNA repair exonuclease SbcCD ATPase subunit